VDLVDMVGDRAPAGAGRHLGGTRVRVFAMSKNAGHIGGWLQVVAACQVVQSLHSDGVRIAREFGKPLFSGRIEIQGVPKFCFLHNPVSG